MNCREQIKHLAAEELLRYRAEAKTQGVEFLYTHSLEIYCFEQLGYVLQETLQDPDVFSDEQICSLLQKAQEKRLLQALVSRAMNLDNFNITNMETCTDFLVESADCMRTQTTK